MQISFILAGSVFCNFAHSFQTPFLINFNVCFFLGNSCIPGNPLGPGGPEGPGGPMGPVGPGVNVDSRTAVISAKTFVKKMVCDKHLHIFNSVFPNSCSELDLMMQYEYLMLYTT
jgi:hypothetical protein